MARIFSSEAKFATTPEGRALLLKVGGLATLGVVLVDEDFGDIRPKKGVIIRDPEKGSRLLIQTPKSRRDKKDPALFYMGQIPPNHRDILEIDYSRTILSLGDPREAGSLGSIIGGGDSRVGLGLMLLIKMGERVVLKPLGDKRIWVVANRGGEFFLRLMTPESYDALFHEPPPGAVKHRQGEPPAGDPDELEDEFPPYERIARFLGQGNGHAHMRHGNRR